jgi:ubiquinone/menaquinone biosynthesis C-methylase UbiE
MHMVAAEHDCHERHVHVAGSTRRTRPSSYAMHDPRVVERELKLRSGQCLLDLGCGAGDYALRAAEWVGHEGSVVALDRSRQAIKDLAREASRRGAGRLRAMVADFALPLPIDDCCVDVCLIATALHMTELDRIAGALFREVRRVLKPGSRLVIIECKKEETPSGPPLCMRHSPSEVEALVQPCGFEKTALTDLGSTYLLRFDAV